MRLAGEQQGHDQEEQDEEQHVERCEQLQRDSERTVGEGDDTFHGLLCNRQKRQNG